MTYDLATRIKDRLDALGKNPSSVALEAGLGRSSVRDIILGRAANPRLDTLRKLTGPLQCTLDYLTGASNDPEKDSNHSHLWWMDTQGVGLVDKAEAGVFRRQLPSITYDVEEASAPASSIHVKYPDPRLVEWRYSLLEVGDSSLVDLHILQGDVATVAAPFSGMQIPLSSGLLVVARRRMPSIDAEEVSIRQIEVHGEQIWLVSRAPEIIKPIVILGFDIDNHSMLLANRYQTEAGAVEIEGVVVRVSRQIPLSDELMDFSYILG